VTAIVTYLVSHRVFSLGPDPSGANSGALLQERGIQMQCSCEVRLAGCLDWRLAGLSDEHASSSYGMPVVVLAGEQPLGPSEVDEIRVQAVDHCPVELFDAAVAAGYSIKGRPC
jgi:hypothetical protein